MSTSINKNGVWFADGVGVNENLIKGSSPTEASFTIPSTSLSDRFTSKTTVVPSGSTYTLSFLAKADVDGAVIRTHYYNPNTTTTCVSSQGRTKTATDGNMDFILTTEWEHYWVTYSQNSTDAVKTIICPRVMSTDYISTQKTGKVYWKMVKFEEGSVATPWVPNSADATYISDVQGLVETPPPAKIYEGTLSGENFIEL